MKNKVTKILIITLCLLLIPLIATQILEDWNWKAGDFLIGGLLIFSFGLLITFIAEKLRNNRYRILIIIGIVLLFLYIWVEIAVGILGTPISGS